MLDKFSVDSALNNSFIEIGEYLYNKLKSEFINNRTIIFLCIGSDRSTGDSLGPLVGHNLKNFRNNSKNIYVYGSLDCPIHCQNLYDTLNKIYLNFDNPFIVAIDAALGACQNVGKVLISDSPLLPGLALEKNLTPVGNMSLIGVVNISSKSQFIILQNTRLNTVFHLAESISKGILYSINKLIEYNSPSLFSNNI